MPRTNFVLEAAPEAKSQLEPAEFSCLPGFHESRIRCIPSPECVSNKANSVSLSLTLFLNSGVNPRPTSATPPPICYPLILDLPNRAIGPRAHHGPSYPSGSIVYLSLELPTTHHYYLSRSSLAWIPWTLTCGIVLLQQTPSTLPCDLHPARAGRLSPILTPPAPSQTSDLDPVVPDSILLVVRYSALLCSLQHG
ncbi:hypothetical protein CCUS01_08628 [Colletotrichum cuscutae]|uniref:Uncharacterized protein n=1 Tax=Colletotrichum cuscutae TaxID=1209917 RepID=A0AAI9UUQ3_9PEZI|nr:hypothetical protein CCUS01_08628 [Colletotrichum cuscutae]